MCGFLCIFRAFLVCALCSGVFSFLQSLPPQPFFRSNSFRCSIASSILSLCASSVQLYPSFLSQYLLLFYSLCPSLFIFPLYTAPDTCPIFSLYVFRVPIPLPLCRPFCPSFLRPWAFRFPLCVFSASLPPPSRCYSPFFPSPFPPLPPSFPRFPSPFLRSFPLLRFPLRKKFPLKSCMISSVKYMFYSIFLACLWKFS